MFKKFINGTINQVTMAAALRRSNTYEAHATDKQKRKFREGLCAELERISKNYKTKVSEKDHLENIKLLQKYSKKYHCTTLIDGQIKIGIAQKALNLYLKLLWSLDDIKEPPHCPIDAIIIRKLSIKDKTNWTEITSIRQYKSLINEIKKKADCKGKSIAEWELKAYQNEI